MKKKKPPLAPKPARLVATPAPKAATTDAAAAAEIPLIKISKTDSVDLADADVTPNTQVDASSRNICDCFLLQVLQECYYIFIKMFFLIRPSDLEPQCDVL